MTTTQEEKRTRVLLTVLGTEPQKTVYTLDGREAESDLAPVALIGLLDKELRPDDVVALCTAEARRVSFGRLRDALDGVCRTICIDVPTGGSEADIKAFLANVVHRVPGGSFDLIVDITHGPRHFSFLTYLAALCLVALRDVQLRGAYYGFYRKGEPKTPFVDLRPLLELPSWIHAVSVLRESGSARAMAGILAAGGSDQLSRRLSGSLSELSRAFLSGLPLELGRQARVFVDQLCRPLSKHLEGVHGLPLSDELTTLLNDALAPLALPDLPQGSRWKRSVPLSLEELERQARIIDALLEGEHTSSALGLLREWTVSWALWRLGRAGDWLDRGAREKATAKLGALAAAQESKDLAPLLEREQAELGRYWGQLRDLRNAYHHHGMRGQVLAEDKNIARCVDEVLTYWNNTLRKCPVNLRLETENGTGRVLVTPLGKSRGVLFSALHACRDADSGFPARCIVICSPQTEGPIEEAAGRAGFPGEIRRFVMDAFASPGEIARLVAQARPLIFAAEQVLVNVTGGTTMMGLVAEAIAAEAEKRLARPVRRFGVMDRRPPQEQEADPYQIGEPFWLDGEKEGGRED